ncbi:MAG: SAM-dependent methyltransferase, partial [Candidatus Woesearchaeota archaeon]|nr:SAM-dependent methyltransferase [Candidatus Woesearchaeota archaeon]
CEGGLFLTQQVEASNLKDLCKEFRAGQKWDSNTLMQVKKYLMQAGFCILDARQWSGKFIFKDVGSIVYFLKAVPWLVPGFSVKKHLTALKKLQKKVDSGKKLVFLQKNFLVLARK